MKMVIAIYQSHSNHSRLKKFMTPFYGCGSTASRLNSHYKEAVYFLPLSPHGYLVLILSTLER